MSTPNATHARGTRGLATAYRSRRRARGRRGARASPARSRPDPSRVRRLCATTESDAVSSRSLYATPRDSFTGHDSELGVSHTLHTIHPWTYTKIRIHRPRARPRPRRRPLAFRLPALVRVRSTAREVIRVRGARAVLGRSYVSSKARWRSRSRRNPQRVASPRASRARASVDARSPCARRRGITLPFSRAMVSVRRS